MKIQSLKKSLFVSALAALAAFPAMSSAVVLTDGNSVVNIDTAAGTGVGTNLWSIDGQNQLQQQWFFFRVGPKTINGVDNPEKSISTLNLLSTKTADLSAEPGIDSASFTYGDAASTFSITVTYSLTGGALGSGNSDIAETIKINNLQARQNLQISFYQYSDLNLTGPGADSVSIEKDAAHHISASQSDTGGPTLSETIVTPKANSWEAGDAADLLAKLSNGVGDDLNNNDTATGDVAWAFQWDAILTAAGHPGSSFLISKDKTIEGVIPEPATLGVLGLGALVLFARRRTV